MELMPQETFFFLNQKIRWIYAYIYTHTQMYAYMCRHKDMYESTSKRAWMMMFAQLISVGWVED